MKKTHPWVRRSPSSSHSPPCYQSLGLSTPGDGGVVRRRYTDTTSLAQPNCDYKLQKLRNVSAFQDGKNQNRVWSRQKMLYLRRTSADPTTAEHLCASIFFALFYNIQGLTLSFNS